MKNLIKLIFTLVFCTTWVALPVYAEEVTETSETPAETSEVTENTAENTTEETDDTEWGEEWSGEIEDPAGEATTEPTSNESETNQGASATEGADTQKSTSFANATKSKKVAANRQTPSTETPATTEDTTTENTTDEATTEKAEEAEETEDFAEIPENLIFVPETAAPSYSARSRKITLMALVSTAIVFFSTLGFYFLANAYYYKSAPAHRKTIKSKTTQKAKDANPLLLPHSR